MGVLAPLLYFGYQRLTETYTMFEGYAFDYLAAAILSGIFSAIYAGGRNGRTPVLTADPVAQGGLQFAGLLVSALFSAFFAAVAGLMLNYINFFRE